ncbi:MAG TPA: diol dehydratase small subunit [Shinella sp.]|jgi:propanediol dehydratase small subunit|uniref:diol dehydratase small subunit n=1 Tax=Shinella sp. TaxID=1870904 RepID=UPI002E0F16A9|nr:diol dehydratase small subunit [Shinella sp.]
MSQSKNYSDIYPLSEKAPELVRTTTGLALDEFTLEAVLDGRVGVSDLAITPEVLRLQAGIARSAGRDKLADNFERAAELVAVPQDLLLSTYELLRPGRAGSAAVLHERAEALRKEFGAEHIATLIEEAADVYDRRGLFSKRF